MPTPIYAAIGASEITSMQAAQGGSGSGGGGIVWSLGTPWSSMIPVIDAAGDATILLVEGDPTGTPRVITGKPDGAGGYLPQDFSHIIFVGASPDLASNTVTVQMDANVRIDPGVLRSKDIMWVPSAANIVANPSPAYEVDLDGGGITPAGPIGGSLFRTSTSNGPNSFRLRNGAILDGTNLAPASEAIARLRPGFDGEVVLNIVSYGGVIGPKCFINFASFTPPPFPHSTTAIVLVDMDAKTVVNPAYTSPGGVSLVSVQQDQTKRDTAGYIAYDDTAANPPLGGTDVQAGIDAVKYMIGKADENPDKTAGIAVTGPGGTVIVANTSITATSRIQLTIQDGGVAPTAGVYVSARTVGVSFTIQSLNPLDVGVQVYYQIWEPA